MQPFMRPLPLERIRIEDTALLVIDMERDFVDAGAVQETPAAGPSCRRSIGSSRGRECIACR